MAIDADPSDPDIDDSILSFVPVEPDGIVYIELGGMTINVPTTLPLQDVDADTDPEITGSTGRPFGTTVATGQANLARFQCIALGSSALHLLTLAEDLGSGSTTMAQEGVIISTSLADATITCSDATPVPTLTPTATPTRAAVGGIAEVPPLAGASDEEARAPADGSGWSSGGHAAAAGGLAAAAIVAVGAWYARRRWAR